MVEAIHPLTDAAKQYFASRYKDITEFREEEMALHLVGIEVVLSSKDLQAAPEDAVYAFCVEDGFEGISYCDKPTFRCIEDRALLAFFSYNVWPYIIIFI